MLWVALFLLVVAISFVLAFQSMRDYSKIPADLTSEYGVFLIRTKTNFTPALLDSIHQDTLKRGLITSIERLFKGMESALVIFGHKSILQNYAEVLNLLELEDYTNVDMGAVSLWEVVLKNSTKNLFKNLNLLSRTEQLWWQLTLLPASEQKGRVKYFQSQIRVGVYLADKVKRDKLVDSIQNATAEQFVKKPVLFSNDQIFKFYKQRSFSTDTGNPSLTSTEVIQLS